MLIPTFAYVSINLYMIKSSLIVALAALLGFTIQIPMKAAIVEAPDTVIIIEPIPGYTPVLGPKAPVVVPVCANYNATQSLILLSFTSNLGEIEVEVLNTTTGGYVSDFVDTQFLYATIPITMGLGHYILLFTLPSGQRYRGEFDL